MDKLPHLRKKIDELDQLIMVSLNTRLLLMKEIRIAKQDGNIQLNDSSRENEILKKADNYLEKDAIKRIYQTIFTESKSKQFPCFLVGKNLSYSYSDLIHQAFGNSNYQLIETSDFPSFINNTDFVGLNITNPYKTKAYEMATIRSDTVSSTFVANLLHVHDGKIKAENVDYDAFLELLDYYHIDCNKKKVLILGNGATAETVKYAVKNRGASIIQKLGRSLHVETDDYLDNYYRYTEFKILINTIPYGVKPNYQTSYLFPFNEFTSLEAIIDVNYNPYHSPFIQEGLKQKNTNLIIANGLYMLVAGGRISEEIWQQRKITSPSTLEVTKQIYSSKINIVLIGLPFSGKTTLGKALAYELKRPFLDTDEILTDQNKTIQSFPSVADFRDAETEVIKEMMAKEGYVLAMGGGVVEREINMRLLSQTSMIIWLDFSLEVLVPRIDSSRPLSDNIDKLTTLKNNRLPLYEKYADIIIKNHIHPINEMVEKIHEYINHQWPKS